MPGIMDVKYKWKVTSGNFGFSILDDGVLLGRYPTKLQLMDCIPAAAEHDPVGYSINYNPMYTEVDLVHHATQLKYRFTLTKE